MNITKRPIGRPSIYTTHIQPYLDIILILKQEGKNDEYIAKLLKVSTFAFVKYKKQIDEFTMAYTQGQQRMVDKAEATLFDVAMGRVQRRMVKVRKDAKGNITSTEETIESMPPDISAIIFILKGHRRSIYNNKDIIDNEFTEIKEEETFASKFLGAIDEK